MSALYKRSCLFSAFCDAAKGSKKYTTIQEILMRLLHGADFCSVITSDCSDEIIGGGGWCVGDFSLSFS